MSRVAKSPVTIPAGVEVNIASGEIVVKGPKGSLAQPIVSDVTVKIEDGNVVFAANGNSKFARAMSGDRKSVV